MRFTKQSVMPLSQSLDGSRGDKDDASSNSNVTGYCNCGREDYDYIIGCDSKDCSIEQFHYSCFKITAKDVPKYRKPKRQGQNE